MTEMDQWIGFFMIWTPIMKKLMLYAYDKLLIIWNNTILDTLHFFAMLSFKLKRTRSIKFFCNKWTPFFNFRINFRQRGCHYVKSIRNQSYSGPYSVGMRENTDQNNSEYGHFLRSMRFWCIIVMPLKKCLNYDVKIGLKWAVKSVMNMYCQEKNCTQGYQCCYLDTKYPLLFFYVNQTASFCLSKNCTE